MIFSCYSHSFRWRLFRNVFTADFRNVLVRKNVTVSNNQLSNEYIFSFQWWRKKLTNIQSLYDEITGLKEVHDAQSRVIEAEKCFIKAQETRRNMQIELTKLQGKLKEIYAELDKTPRGEDRYVQLVTMEHSIIKEEKRTHEVFQEKEKDEREYFNTLSSAVKMGHEKERAQAERTKYWSIIGSVIGTFLGMLASTIVNNRRMKELRTIVENSVSMKVDSREDHSNLLKDILFHLKSKNEEDYSNLLKDNKCQLEQLVSSVQKLNENVYNGTEKSYSGFPSGVAVALVLSAVITLLFKQ